MPWKQTQAMDQRIEFVMKALSCRDFAGLCRDYGISRKTGYKWRERFLNEGIAGMAEQNRRPKSHANELSEAEVCAIVKLRQAHPYWGARKLQELYRRAHGMEPPSESSFKRVLERAGMTRERRRREARQSGRLARGLKAEAPNDVWSVDFKGWWHDNDGRRIEPLTVRDEHSRMILELRRVANARTETIRACFERLFETHGLPAAIRSDNGPPFASANALHGLSRLSVWWLALGIDLERSRPGCPQDNGAHERMHRDVKKELQAGRAGCTQEAFDLWRQEFNTERPHESLGMATPAECYQPSVRPYEGTPEVLDYQGRETRRVRKNGTLCFSCEPILISTSLAGWDVAFGEQEDNRIELWFSSLLLGHWHTDTLSFRPATPPPAGGATGGLAASAPLQRPNHRSNA
jgi:transposase InsO family protein